MHVIDTLGRLKVSSGTSTLNFMSKNEAGTNYRVKDANFQLANATTLAWHTIYIQGTAGNEQVVLGGSDSSTPADLGFMPQAVNGLSYRFFDGNFHLWNVTQGIWQTIWCRGTQIQVGND